MRALHKLQANFIRRVRRPGRYGDGGNLHLQITEAGSRSWVFQYERSGERRAMGLGPLPSVSLATARELAAQCRDQLARGIDPIDVRKAGALAAKAERAKATTFEQTTEEYLAFNRGKWRYARHAGDWLASLQRYAYPVLGKLSVSAIDSGLVVKVLQPLLAANKPVLASRVRGRIELVIDFAIAAGRFTGTNPATKTVIGNLLPLRSEKADVQHQPALPFAKVPALLAAARKVEGPAARELEMTVLSSLRHSAVHLATVGEFDLSGAMPIWTVPASRMKTLGRDHVVPLVGRALEIARELTQGRAAGEPLFANDFGRIGRTAASSLLSRLLPQIGHEEHCVLHGFRSALKDWAAETTSHPPEAVEMALGHRIKNIVERSYRRGDLLQKRRALMHDWNDHCLGRTAQGEVIPLRR